MGSCKSIGKHPRTKHGLKDATTDEATITKWWTTWPDANVAVLAGVSFVVVDVDCRHGGDDTLKAMEELHGSLPPIEKELDFIADTGIYCYAPPIGTAHGFYKATPKIRYDRMEYLVQKTNMPMVLHGGTGLTPEVYKRLIALGAAKVNISTALKKTYADGFANYLQKNPTQYDPLKLIGAVLNDVTAMAQEYLKLFGSEGQA